jgi:predicted nucleotide-binding protein
MGAKRFRQGAIGMGKSKVFIASSGAALELAKQLRAQLDPKTCEGKLWTEVSQQAAGQSILTMLKEAAKEYDFAVIILTNDDVMVGQAGQMPKARDNCVFEAGLFMGVIGQDRCFLLSSVEARNLPSDLGGIIYLPFTEPQNLADPNACMTQTATAATRIGSAIWTLGPIKNRPLSAEQLLEREKSTGEGGDLLMDQVVVASVQPLDVGYEAARQVRNNIDKGNIQYVYFFQGDDNGAKKTCQLLQMLLLANILENQAEANNWQGRLAKVKTNLTEIKLDLEQLCTHGMIKIYFLPEAPALQYVIHNAGDNIRATIYLKRGQAYFEWESGAGAYRFWNEVRKAHGALAPQPPKAMFYLVPDYKLSEGDFVNTLNTVVDIYFPGIKDDVVNLCLKGPTTN